MSNFYYGSFNLSFIFIMIIVIFMHACGPNEELLMYDIPEKIGVCGDSISRAFNAGSTPFIDAPSVSWATGDNKEDIVFSHLERLEQLSNGKKIKSFNYAKTGANSFDFYLQAAKLSLEKPDYVMVLMGNNDICVDSFDEITSPETYEYNMRIGLLMLMTAVKDIKILLVTLPYHLSLIDAGKEAGCEYKRELIGLCDILNDGMSDEEMEEFFQISRVYNSILEKLALEYSENIKLSRSVQYYNFEGYHLSQYDCFHPNKTAQKLLSEVTWNEGFWANVKMDTEILEK